MAKGKDDIGSDFGYEFLLTDISAIAAKRIGINTSIGLGYLIRIEEDAISHRANQQFSVLRRLPGLSLSHRFSTDQTFSGVETPEFRLRYRISTEIPLEGLTLDPLEFFVRLNNEYLNSLEGKNYELEIRLVGFLGYAISDNGKIELGLDYRLDSFINNPSRNRFWIGINFYQSI